MTHAARLWMLAVVLAALFGLGACDREGPVERAGEEVDEAGRSVGEAAEDARD